MATFITSKAVGETINIYVGTSTAFWKYNHDGSDSSVFGGGEQTISVTNINGEFTIISCDESGNVSGDITNLNLQNNQLTSFDGTGLSSLTHLFLNDNLLTSFDGTGLSSLLQLYLDNNQLTPFDGTGLSSLTYLELGGNQLTSLDGFIFPTSLTYLGLYNNLLTSFDGTGLSNLPGLELGGNQLTSFDVTGLSGLTQLGLSNNQLTSFDGTGLSGLTILSLGGNQLTPSSNNQILQQLNQNGLSGGEFYSTGGRTSASNTDYDNLVNNLGWYFEGLDLIAVGSGKLRVKGVNSGGVPTQPSMLYNIDENIGGVAQSNYVRYNSHSPSQILTDNLTFSSNGRNGSNSTLLQSIAVNQLIKITQEDNPSIYQQFRVMSIFTPSLNETYYTVEFDVFTISNFPHGMPVVVTVTN